MSIIQNDLQGYSYPIQVSFKTSRRNKKPVPLFIVVKSNLVILQKPLNLGWVLVHRAISLGLENWSQELASVSTNHLIGFHPELFRTNIIHARNTCTVFGRRVARENPLSKLVNSLHVLTHNVDNFEVRQWLQTCIRCNTVLTILG